MAHRVKELTLSLQWFEIRSLAKELPYAVGSKKKKKAINMMWNICVIKFSADVLFSFCRRKRRRKN